MIDFSKFDNLISLVSYFSSNDKCKKAIIESRWSDGDVVCPYCGEHHCVERTDGRFRCNACGRNFSCLVDTIFENTNLPLIKWFVAMYLISSHKMRTPHTQGRSTRTKTPVFGMMERSTYVNENGEDENITYVHAFVVENTNRATLQPIIQQFVDEGSTVITDELNAYNGLSGLGYSHYIVNHGAQEYANGEIFTNSIEGFWSHFRRMIGGCYHDVSDEHLQSYINEAVYRWNTRKMRGAERFAQMFEMSVGIVRRWSEIKVGLMAA